MENKIDFELIKRLNDQIAKELEKRPKYKEWWKMVKLEMAKSGNNRNNRMVTALNFAFSKQMEIIEVNEDLKKEIIKANEIITELKDD